MPTIVLDFDSTLITRESLDDILLSKLGEGEEAETIRKLCEKAMAGKMGFEESFRKRIGMVPLNRSDFEAFGERAVALVTEGMAQLVKELDDAGVDVWVVSGAVQETLEAVGRALGIPAHRLQGVKVEWTPDGMYAGVHAENAYRFIKWKNAEKCAPQWKTPRIGVGDGMTDFELYSHGIVDDFIAFTKNVRRKEVVAVAKYEAASVKDLKRIIQEKLHG